MLFYYLHSIWMSNVYYLDSGKGDNYYASSNAAVNNINGGSMGTMMDDETGESGGSIYNSGLGYNSGRASSASFPISRSQAIMMGQDGGRIMRDP
jgi:hypothetical protein